jgi:flagellar biogenesis protein FliO
MMMIAGGLAVGFSVGAQTNLIPAVPLSPPPLPDVAPSVFRVLGALALVIGIFLGGVWLYRNWQRLTQQRGGRPKLNIIETRSLGGRQALHVVGYEQARFLVATSPNGVTLLSPLPVADAEATPTGEAPPSAFQLTLAKMLKGK